MYFYTKKVCLGTFCSWKQKKIKNSANTGHTIFLSYRVALEKWKHRLTADKYPRESIHQADYKYVLR